MIHQYPLRAAWLQCKANRKIIRTDFVDLHAIFPSKLKKWPLYPRNCFRYMVGVTPSTVLNTSQKYFDSLKPVRDATCEILRFVSCSSSFADSNRTRVISLLSERPNSALILRSSVLGECFVWASTSL